ncbi:MAG TPA: permease prefix domain 1-containing protein [Dehalococcoidia bacterium]|nr:permease prefix domain 1-containing protein [Dehalococcoidia bacterium]
MVSSISHYLHRFKASLKIDHTIRDGVAAELRAHLEDRTRELEENGLSKEEATKIAVQSLGSPELIAEQIYETHAQGTWKDAIFSASPHLLVALLFTSYYWQNVIYASIILALTVGIAIYGWRQGKPIWLFPWLGYYFMPVVVSGILLLSLPEGWGWIAALIYIPLVLFVFIHIMKQTARRDWLYASLMLAPMLVTFAWFSSLGKGNELLASDWAARLQTNALWIVISFVALAAATVAFIRLKPRRYKIISLLIPPLVVLFAVITASGGNICSWSWVLLLFSLSAFAIPLWMQAKAYE